NGFSLIEVLVAIVALSLVTFTAANLMFNTFKNSTKTQVVGTVKQAGQNVLNSFSDEVRSASGVVCITDSTNVENTTNGQTLVIKNNDQYIRYRFVDETGIKNGSINRDEPVVSGVP